MYEITDPIPISEWLEVVTTPGRELEVLPYDSRITGGRYDGGHVIALHTEDNTIMYVVPPEVIVLLKGMLTDDQYRGLLSRTPRLATLAGRERTPASMGSGVVTRPSRLNRQPDGGRLMAGPIRGATSKEGTMPR